MVSIESAEHYIWGEQCHGWHLLKTPELSIIQELVPPGCSEVRHYHINAQQFFFVLEGIATLEIDGVVHSILAQQGLHVSAGARHKLSNNNDVDLVFLVTSTPSSHGDRVDILE